MPFSSGVTSLSGQTISLDLAFTSSFIRVVANSTPKNFEILCDLSLTGNGSLPFLYGTAYTTDKNGIQNSPTQVFGTGGVVTNGTENTGYLIGYSFPLTNPDFSPRTGLPNLFNIYGFHLSLTLPVNDQFTINGTYLFLGGGGSPSFNIGLPEVINPLYFLAFSFVILVLYRKIVCT
jgi:hypothetical protein